MSNVSTFLALASVLALLLSGATPAAGLGAAPDGHARALDGGELDDDALPQVDDASASFGEANVSVERGDEVTITVSHSDPATLTIGGPEYGFHVTVSLGGSGSTEVVLDTRATTAADPNEFIEGGSATLHSAPLEEPMEPEDYLLRVDIDDVERDIGTLTVEPRGDFAADSSRAPGAFEPEEHVGGGEEGDASVGPLEESMTAGSTVARGDYAVVHIEESGLETALNASDLTGSAAANGLKVNFTQTDPGPNHEPSEYVATDTANVTVLPNFENDELYVVWNTTGVGLESRSERNRYRASLTLTDESGLSESSETVATTTFQLERQSVSLSTVNDSVHYPWDDGAFAVAGSTNRAPNTDLEVRLRSPDPNAFLQLRETTVGDDGDFEASFDLSSVSRGTNATLWVRNHRDQTVQTVYLVAPDPSVRIENQTVNGTTVEIASAEIPEGGFVRLEDAAGDPVGRSDYLPPGQHEAVSAELETPVFETQPLRAELVRPGQASDDEGAADDGTPPYDPDSSSYVANGSVVVDSAVIEFPPAPTETSTATQTSTATSTPTATSYPVVTRTPLAPAGASQSSLPLSPGVAVAALLGASALLARRGDSA
ncbi:DUF7282 domain-containing protein [Halobellus sp. GM3]|uniref:DUF7282 domain-containing protein n=1 Tax=Halobellus sp. GM3 TaxID=3458410 RepID=UPI00403D7915